MWARVFRRTAFDRSAPIRFAFSTDLHCSDQRRLPRLDVFLYSLSRDAVVHGFEHVDNKEQASPCTRIWPQDWGYASGPSPTRQRHPVSNAGIHQLSATRIVVPLVIICTPLLLSALEG